MSLYPIRCYSNGQVRDVGGAYTRPTLVGIDQPQHVVSYAALGDNGGQPSSSSFRAAGAATVPETVTFRGSSSEPVYSAVNKKKNKKKSKSSGSQQSTSPKTDEDQSYQNLFGQQQTSQPDTQQVSNP